jgi:hypothetical protein
VINSCDTLVRQLISLSLSEDNQSKHGACLQRVAVWPQSSHTDRPVDTAGGGRRGEDTVQESEEEVTRLQ